MIGQDPYYLRQEVSNSDLSALMKYFLPPQQWYDIEQAYRFGNLIDAMITEPHRCDHYGHKVDGVQFTAEEWEKATQMLYAFRKNDLCQSLWKVAEGQKISVRDLEIEYNGIQFTLPMRCKWDMWMELLRHGADIKSTTATTERQFKQAIQYFNYDQQRALYMDMEGSEKDLLIGISKVNFKIFMVPIQRGDDLYLSGLEKYQRAAFKYWTLFDNFKLN